MALFKRRKPPIERETIRIAHSMLGRDLVVELHPELDAVTLGDTQLNFSNLRSFYNEQDPTSARDWLETSLRDLLVIEPVPGTFEVDSPVLPTVRSKAFVEAHRLMSLTHGGLVDPLATSPVTDSLVAGLIWDRPSSMISVSEAQLETWQRSYTEVMDVALSNLADLPVPGWANFEGRAFSVIADDEFASARILIPDLFEELSLEGDLVVCIPTRTSMFVASFDEPEGVDQIFDLALGAIGTGPAVSLIPVVVGAEGIADLMLDADHPALAKLRRLHRLDQAENYESTRAPLQDFVGSEVFVGSLIVRTDLDSGAVDTVSVWSEGVPTLLARADVVSFPHSDRDADFVSAPWDRVREVLGPKMAATDHFPERWLVEVFPDQPELAALASL